MLVKSIFIWFIIGAISLILSSNTSYEILIPEFWNSSVISTTLKVELKLIFLVIGITSIIIAFMLPIVKSFEIFENWTFAKDNKRIFLSMFGLLALAFIILMLSDFFR